MKLAILFGTAFLLVVLFLVEDQADRRDLTPDRPRRLSSTASPRANDPPAPPFQPITPQKLGIRPPEPVTDHPAHLRQLIAADDGPAVQSATLRWFQADPAAARDWILSQPDLTPLELAISYIASHISESDDLDDALEFADIIPSEHLRVRAFHDILAAAIRDRRITTESLDLTGLPKDVIDDLSSGAPLD